VRGPYYFRYNPPLSNHHSYRYRVFRLLRRIARNSLRILDLFLNILNETNRKIWSCIKEIILLIKDKRYGDAITLLEKTRFQLLEA
jgi:hypothetical protein